MSRLPSFGSLSARGVLRESLTREVYVMGGYRYIVEWRRGEWVVIAREPNTRAARRRSLLYQP
ncbi:MAG: hypothetical protein ACREMZ_16430 [Gemmatimonadales bacterium]